MLIAATRHLRTAAQRLVRQSERTSNIKRVNFLSQAYSTNNGWNSPMPVVSVWKMTRHQINKITTTIGNLTTLLFRKEAYDNLNQCLEKIDAVLNKSNKLPDTNWLSDLDKLTKAFEVYKIIKSHNLINEHTLSFSNINKRIDWLTVQTVQYKSHNNTEATFTVTTQTGEKSNITIPKNHFTHEQLYNACNQSHEIWLTGILNYMKKTALFELSQIATKFNKLSHEFELNKMPKGASDQIKQLSQLSEYDYTHLSNNFKKIANLLQTGLNIPKDIKNPSPNTNIFSNMSQFEVDYYFKQKFNPAYASQSLFTGIRDHSSAIAFFSEADNGNFPDLYVASQEVASEYGQACLVRLSINDPKLLKRCELYGTTVLQGSKAPELGRIIQIEAVYPPTVETAAKSGLNMSGLE